MRRWKVLRGELIATDTRCGRRMTKLILYDSYNRLNKMVACLNSIQLEVGRALEQLAKVRAEMNVYGLEDNQQASMVTSDLPKKREEKLVVCSNEKCLRKFYASKGGYVQHSEMQVPGFINKAIEPDKWTYTLCSMGCLEAWSNSYSHIHSDADKNPYQKDEIIRG